MKYLATLSIIGVISAFGWMTQTKAQTNQVLVPQTTTQKTTPATKVVSAKAKKDRLSRYRVEDRPLKL